MTPQEMHIGLDLLLQKVNSKFIDSFEPEEKDWALNEEVLRFVKQRISSDSNDKHKGFEDDQKRFDDLKPLIKPATLPAYIRDDNSVFSYLPSDYLSLTNDRTITKDLCGSPYSSIGTTNITKYINCINIKDDLINLYKFFKIRINGTQVFSLSDYPVYSNGLPSQTSKFELINLVLRVLSDQGYICKYKNYFDFTCQGGIILVSNISFSIDCEYSPTDIITTISSTKALIQINSINKGNEVPNRLTNTEPLYNLLNSSFGNTISSNPLSTLEGDKIIVFHKQKFIASTINISYLKYPRKISLSLNQDCDLDDWIQLEVVDNTAKRLAGLIGSEDYKQIINENLLKE